MKSSTLLALAALPLLVAQPALSQPDFFLPPPDGGPLEELNLTSDQQSQIQQIIKSSHDRSKPLLQQLRQMGQDTRKQIDGVLTAEQREQLKQRRAERFDQAQ
ncbi:hypothetical protein [Gloeobacter kilaueensis]|uniref:P pilus assembly/Cpx signaling pathway, periplasmic inhibitor/zinc-resistance associated protein n=1 Tax=Gloeobacter kilaueensis (strain ATCC BAA-2537 / CCAP 1431/1 / ULC 316 / JS1) TaxID=1183438 RepID=U5QBX8_GLOK1|nr:hypothetical protein [Gloeobacter kilaueensis]AGY56402.1 hypothetical protein GKIL_0155 [Gloeobacter kilaueensis JS1]